MDTTHQVPPGLYRHFKGGVYMVVGVAKHVDSPDEFVVYRAYDGHDSLFVRPMDAFVQCVQVDGEQRRRFEYLGPANEGAADDSYHLACGEG